MQVIIVPKRVVSASSVPALSSPEYDMNTTKNYEAAHPEPINIRNHVDNLLVRRDSLGLG